MNYFKADMFAAFTQVRSQNLSAIQKLLRASLQLQLQSGPSLVCISNNFVLFCFIFHLICDFKFLLIYRFSPQPLSLFFCCKIFVNEIGSPVLRVSQSLDLLIASTCSLMYLSDFSTSQDLVGGSGGLVRFRFAYIGNTISQVVCVLPSGSISSFSFCDVSSLAVQFVDPVIY